MMGVKDIEITNLEGRRFTKRGERVSPARIDTNSTVTQVTLLDKKQADVEFRFTVSYGGGGVLKVEGRLLYEGTDAPELVTEWSAKHNMPNKIANEIHNAVVQICMTEAVLIARDLQLPPPIPMPRVNFEEKKKPGRTDGIEVA